MSSGNDLLMGGGGKSVLWGRDDSTKMLWVSGTVMDEPTTGQVLDYSTKKPKFYDGGTDPIMQIIVKIQTTMREDDEDDGSRNLYIKGGNMKAAVRDAIKAAGAKGLEIGGMVAVRWTGTEGDNDMRTWEAAYKRGPAPANTALMNADPFGQPAAAPAQAAPAPQAQPFATTTQTNTAPPAQLTPQQIANPDPAPNGVDPVMWASMAPIQRDAMKQLLGLTGAAGAPVQRDAPPF